MKEIDSTEMFHGKEIADKDKQFKAELQKIEEKHKEYFKERISSRFKEEHDRLHNHYIIYISNGTVMFNFTPDSDIAEYIKEECFDAFQKVFPGSKRNAQSI